MSIIIVGVGNAEFDGKLIYQTYFSWFNLNTLEGLYQ